MSETGDQGDHLMSGPDSENERHGNRHAGEIVTDTAGQSTTHGSLVAVALPRVEVEEEEPVEDPRTSDVDRWGRSENARRFARKLSGFYYRTWFRVEWEGLENIPTEGGALLVANH